MIDWISVIWRVAAACSASLVLSILALASVKRIGVDLKDMNQRTNPKVLVMAGLFNALFIAAVAALMQVGDGAPLSVLGFSLSGRAASLAVLTLFGTPAMALAFVRGLHKNGTVRVSRVHHFWKSSRGVPAVLLGFAVLFVAALQEEVLFRGYFAFAMHAYSWIMIMVVSALVFTVWHFLTNRANLFQTIDWLLGGLTLFYVYHLTGSIIAAALMHFSRNATNVLVFNIVGSGGMLTFDKPVPPHWKTLYTISNSLLIAALAFLLFS